VVEILGKQQRDWHHAFLLYKVIGKFSWADIFGLGIRSRWNIAFDFGRIPNKNIFVWKILGWAKCHLQQTMWCALLIASKAGWILEKIGDEDISYSELW